ncbi:hypothetical protein J2Y58_000767 [Sphingomonas sp. BE138]|uniref:hypothetical protein n=1 Tax=Sphingomonas sp. BE138 TaxID=2817845 RepID=UPI0028626A84|nr:hypothetical protein [Sphingomonas sp. BE138]MDR6787426.1 hypothetical protein [Sphingomonas sp. BE138]
MAQMQLSAEKREVGWSALGLGVTALAFKGAAWSYPQGADTIWLVGAATLAAVGVLGARDVWRVRRQGDAA